MVWGEVETLAEGREELFLKLEELLKGESLNLYVFQDIEVNAIFKNGSVLIKSDNKMQELMDKVNYNLVYRSKSKRYRQRFQSAYESNKKSLKSKSNVSLNTAITGLIGPADNPEKKSNGYNSYERAFCTAGDLRILSKELFKNINSMISINNLVKELFTIKIDGRDETPETEVDDEKEVIKSESEYSRNKIIFGPPGTGKSYSIKNKMGILNVDDKNIRRITFHPEYSYYEFVGQYKPVVAYEAVGNRIEYPSINMENNKKAFVYYDFVPGPFTNSIIDAMNNKENVLLIIEEINRGNSSAIFGDIFQLLDRINDVNNDYYGESEYSIEIPIEMENYIKTRLDKNEEEWKKIFPRGFVLPSNLFIYGTMNTSDQSLYPMDSAFKRRWDMEYMSIDYDERRLKDMKLPEPYSDILWLDFIKEINEKVVEYTRVDDKQLGQWFVGNRVNRGEFTGKVLSYLWFDIFRHNPGMIFKDSINTFDDIIEEYEKGVFKDELMDEIRDKSVK